MLTDAKMTIEVRVLCGSVHVIKGEVHSLTEFIKVVTTCSTLDLTSGFVSWKAMVCFPLVSAVLQ